MASVEKSVSELTKIYRAAQRDIIREIKTASEFRASELVAINRQIDQILGDLSVATDRKITDEIERHYKSGFDKAVASMRSAGIQVSGTFAVLDEESIAAMVDESFTLFGQSLQAASRSSTAVLSQARRIRIRDLLAEGRITGKTRREISGAISEELSKGVVALRDRGGRTWDMDRYAEMLTRTKLMEARNTGLGNRLTRSGYDLVQVSDHGTTHAECADWEGKILSLTGETKSYNGQTIYTVEYAKAAGLFHPNCKHRYLPFHPQFALTPPLPGS